MGMMNKLKLLIESKPPLATNDVLEYLDKLVGGNEARLAHAETHLKATYRMSRIDAGDVVQYWHDTYDHRNLEGVRG